MRRRAWRVGADRNRRAQYESYEGFLRRVRVECLIDSLLTVPLGTRAPSQVSELSGGEGVRIVFVDGLQRIRHLERGIIGASDIA